MQRMGATAAAAAAVVLPDPGCNRSSDHVVLSAHRISGSRVLHRKQQASNCVVFETEDNRPTGTARDVRDETGRAG
jgi:hypothetical protein